MTKYMFRFLLWWWCRQAEWSYDRLSERGELFNTASFQDTVYRSTRWKPSSSAARDLLFAAGYYAKKNSAHWFDNSDVVEESSAPQDDIIGESSSPEGDGDPVIVRS
jgi:hypothetical protein